MSDHAGGEVRTITGAATLVCASAVVVPWFPAVEHAVNVVAIVLGAVGLLVLVGRIVLDHFL